MKKDVKFFELLASRILYQLTQRGLIRMQGATAEETQANIKQARDLMCQMISSN